MHGREKRVRGPDARVHQHYQETHLVQDTHAHTLSMKDYSDIKGCYKTKTIPEHIRDQSVIPTRIFFKYIINQRNPDNIVLNNAYCYNYIIEYNSLNLFACFCDKLTINYLTFGRFKDGDALVDF